MLEANVEDALKREARKRGVWALKAEHLYPGFTDRLLLAPPEWGNATGGRFALVELKRPGGKRRTAQRIVRKWLAKLGIEAHLLETPEEVRRFFSLWLD